MGEKRIEVREKTFIAAHIVYDSGNTTVDCIVREVSASGMRLEVNDNQSIPKEFDLHVPRRGSLYRVRVAWRDSVTIGVEITNDDPKSPRPKGSPEVQRLQRENSMLRARLDDALAQLRSGDIISQTFNERRSKSIGSHDSPEERAPPSSKLKQLGCGQTKPAAQ